MSAMDLTQTNLLSTITCVLGFLPSLVVLFIHLGCPIAPFHCPALRCFLCLCREAECTASRTGVLL